MKNTTLIPSMLAVGLVSFAATPAIAEVHTGYEVYTGYTLLGENVSGRFGYPVDAPKITCADLPQYKCLERPETLRLFVEAFGNVYTEADDVDFPIFPQVYFGDVLPILSFFSVKKQTTAIGISGKKFYFGYEPPYPDPANVQGTLTYLPWTPDPLPKAEIPDGEIIGGGLTDLGELETATGAPEPSMVLGGVISIVAGWFGRRSCASSKNRRVKR
jgi:hypothetical protein